jgi:hypothetical protein
MTKEDIKQLIREAIIEKSKIMTEMNVEDFGDDTRRFLQMFPHKVAMPSSQVTTPKATLPKVTTPTTPKIKKPRTPKGYTLTPKEIELLRTMPEKQRLVFYIKKRRKARIALGLCAECGEPAEKNKDGTSKTYCTKHLKQRHDLIQSLIDRGICIRCMKNPVVEKNGKKLRFCADCAKIQGNYAKKKRLEYLRKNICTICHKNPPYTDPKTGKKLTICKKCSDIVKKQHILYRKRAKLKKS